MNALPQWDGIPRIELWLHTYGGAEDTEYTRTIGPKFLVGAVARAMSTNGCKMDNLLGLVGDQGTQKSTAFEVLGGPFYKSNLNVHDLHGKEARQEIRGSWIIEMPELSTLRRSLIDATKAFLGELSDTYRPSYGRGNITVPRRCVFCGTTNRNQPFLQDNEPQRRFWICQIKRFDIEALARDREQLLAEAKAMFEAGEPWHVDYDKDEAFQAATEAAQEECRTQDPWCELIENYLETTNKTETSVTDCLKGILLPATAMDKRAEMRCASILGTLRWKDVGQKRVPGSRRTVLWVRP